MMREFYTPGTQYRYDNTNWALISNPLYRSFGTATVVWDDGENVHYTTDRDPHNVKQTPVERFAAIVGPLNQVIASY